jgi:hypothetical protein
MTEEIKKKCFSEIKTSLEKDEFLNKLNQTKPQPRNMDVKEEEMHMITVTEKKMSRGVRSI